MAKQAPEAQRIVPERFAEDRWAPYGWVPKRDTDPADGDQRLAFEWADAHVNLIGHSVDEVPHRPGVLTCAELFRHRTHTQVLMALDHPCVVVVAPPGSDVVAGRGLGGLSAFILEPLEPIVLHRATWHWGPYPTASRSVTLFNVQGLRYAEDNERLDLAAQGLMFEVELPKEASAGDAPATAGRAD